MKIPYELLIKYSKNSCTGFEKNIVEEWLQDGDNLDLYLDFRKEWVHLDNNIHIPDKRKVWKKVNKTAGRKTSLYKKLAYAGGVAALLATIYFVLFSPADQRPVETFAAVKTEKGEKATLTLTDGSKLWLNSESEIRFPSSFNTDSRMVDVTGEVYMEVAGNPEKKFTANLGPVKIVVLGTSFNVYSGENIRISLIEGKIEVIASATGERMLELLPDQAVDINPRTLAYSIYSADAKEQKLWAENELSIYDRPISEIVPKLQIWYGVSISYSGFDENKRYTFYLTNESITDFLALFNNITPVNYEYNGKHLTISPK